MNKYYVVYTKGENQHYCHTTGWHNFEIMLSVLNEAGHTASWGYWE